MNSIYNLFDLLKNTLFPAQAVKLVPVRIRKTNFPY